MAVGETAKLIASLELANKMGPGLASVNRDLGKLESRGFRAGQQIGTGIKNAGRIAAVGIAAVASQVVLGLDSLVKLEQAEAQTGAVLKSTGQAAGQNAADITRLSEKYEAMNAIVGDEFVRAGQNMLLTFTNIKGKAFEPTLQAVLDMNTAMGKGPEGLTTTAILVGKALNDPTKGMTALRRVGVAFTADQEKKIKSLQKEGKLYEAQKFILKELNKEFGGSFAAQGDTTAGKVAKFHDSIEDLQRTLASAFLPVVSKVADALSSFLADPAVIRGVSELGTKLAGLFSNENMTAGANVLKALFQTAKDVAPALSAAAQVIGTVVKSAVSMFTSLPKELQGLLIGGLAVNKLTGGLVTNIAGGLISSVLKQLVSGVVNVNGGVVNVVGTGGLGGAAGGVAGAAKGGIGTLGKMFLVGEAIGLVAAVVGVQQAVSGGNTEFAGVIETQTGKFIATQPSRAALESALAGVDQGIADLTSNPLNVLVQGDALTKLQQMRADLAAALAKTDPTSPTGPKNPRSSDPAYREWKSNKDTAVVTAVENLKSNIGPSLSQIPTKLSTVASNTIEAGIAAKNASQETKAQIASSAMVQQALLGAQMATTRVTASSTQSTVRGVAPPIVSAIRAIPAPQTFVSVNVSATHVTKSTTIQNRYCPCNGSSGQNQRSGELEY